MIRVVIWGAGAKCRIVLDAIRRDKCNLVGIIDTNEALHGKFYNNQIQILAPQELNNENVEYVVISVLNSNEILQQCTIMGIEKNKIIDYWNTNKKYEFIDTNIKRVYDLERELANCKRKLRNMPFELGVKPSPIIRSAEELLELIIKEKKSLSRFGDGELEIIQKRERPWFQVVDEKLSERLKMIFHCTDERIIIALADDFGSLEQYTETAADAIRAYLDNGVREDIMKLIDMERVYYDAYVTRPYLIYQDKMRAGHIFDLFKEVWKERNILIVEGSQSYTGIRNDLFACANSVQRIIAPSKNAFSEYDKILSLVIQHASDDILVLVSLGPTATVLTYDLAVIGIQALDIGQLDNEYEWYLRKADTRIMIPGKCVAELKQCHEIPLIKDNTYNEQVVARV